ncbi:hypothetical protein [Paenibacillus sp. YN15]|uniref:hypothetical protein n=1 Tax=Paenibacillus sp. YN15 TaxID=1742774 RepID=UPI000DCCFE5E|nr:hypothetical protein [Paenibacillus sp. YN15]RAU96797.1 hypothetical protein DQG13_19765 [Paenibacillus sp. YN15]
MKTEMQIQQENVLELIRLIAENPELRILPMVDSEIVADEGYCSWVGCFGEAQVDEVFSKGERLYIRSDDEEGLIEEVYDNLDGPITDEEAEETAKEIVSGYEWEKVILVRIACP